MAMDAAVPDRADEHPDFVDRREVLRLAGSVGLASMLSACSSTTRIDSVAARETGPTPPSAPSPAVTSATSARTSASLTTTTSALLLCRDAWGARPAGSGGRRHTITRMTLHHQPGVLGDNGNAPGHLRQDQRYHQAQLGWIDIAYHVGVDRNGNIYELRSTEIAGDTATDYHT